MLTKRFDRLLDNMGQTVLFATQCYGRQMQQQEQKVGFDWTLKKVLDLMILECIF